jgi:hypothetical protein
MTPREHALAFRIWHHCEPIGWDCTISEVAEALGVNRLLLGQVAAKKGWSSRFRSAKPDSTVRTLARGRWATAGVHLGFDT